MATSQPPLALMRTELEELVRLHEQVQKGVARIVYLLPSADGEQTRSVLSEHDTELLEHVLELRIAELQAS